MGLGFMDLGFRVYGAAKMDLGGANVMKTYLIDPVELANVRRTIRI